MSSIRNKPQIWRNNKLLSNIFIYFDTFMVISFRTSMFSFRESYSGWWAYSIGDMLERNLFFRYPGLGTVLHWRDTEMKNLLPTLPYFRLWQIIILHGMDSTISFYVCIKDECRDFTFLSTSYWDKSWTLSFVGVESTHGWQSLIRCQTNIL